MACNIHEGGPGENTPTNIHVPAIRQPAIPDSGQDCHAVCSNDDAVTVKLSFL